MARARSIPRQWLLTDERLGGRAPDDPLWRAVARLPRGAGILFRHHSTPEVERRALLARLAVVARTRGLVLVGAGRTPAPDGVHWSRHLPRAWPRGRQQLVTAPARSRSELLRAFAAGADLVFLSPVFETASHPGRTPLGPVRFGLAARGAPGPVIALGGMTRARWRRLAPLGASGFAAIGWWAALASGRRRA